MGEAGADGGLSGALQANAVTLPNPDGGLWLQPAALLGRTRHKALVSALASVLGFRRDLGD